MKEITVGHYASHQKEGNVYPRLQDAIKTVKRVGILKDWIPVKDRLPPENPAFEADHMGKRSDTVLIYSTWLEEVASRHADSPDAKTRPMQRGFYLYSLNEWRIEGSNNDEEVSHWMPLPQPPVQPESRKEKGVK